MESIKYYDDKITDLYLKYDSVIDYESSIFVLSLNNIFSIINETESLKNEINCNYSSENIEPDDTLIEVFNETLNILQAKIRNDVFFQIDIFQELAQS